ncbi:hypothetical protein BpHYR1_044455 [Brachionus plicatilis]|uniref:Uncharacterized protein n=1 Tax=Brachionus plicatilis TaxID=10195 RepID=A0A3M7RJ98_BRAPC|nr:hypothetical protein BpHYR1_044455 [Brachionus plicatilis]
MIIASSQCPLKSRRVELASSHSQLMRIHIKKYKKIEIKYNLNIPYSFCIYSTATKNCFYKFFGPEFEKKITFFTKKKQKKTVVSFYPWFFQINGVNLVPKNSNFKESWIKADDSFKNDKNKKNKIPSSFLEYLLLTN